MNTRTCSRCGVAFMPNPKARSTKSGCSYYWCTVCINAKAKAWRAANPEKADTRIKGAVLRNREYLLSVKRAPCADCKQTFHHAAMDLDHVRGNKLFPLGKTRAQALSVVQEEVAKCELVCSNCHRVRTFVRRWGTLDHL